MKAEILLKLAEKRMLVVDGHAYAYRAHFAIRKLTSPEGKPVNAIFGFVQMIEALIEELSPTHICVVWDGGLSPIRTGLLPGYKAQRPPMPDKMRVQLDGMVDYLKADGIKSFCEDDVEADDYIAWLALKAVAAGFAVVIASSDKDFMQLVSDRVVIKNPNEKSGELMGVEEVTRKTGVAPGQIVDWLSLIGDNVDNIPGVPGVGPKTASGLLTEFDSISGLYERIGEVGSERLRDGLERSKERVRMNQRLIELNSGLSYEFDEARFSRGARDLSALRSLCKGWGFRRMLSRLEEGGQTTPELALN